MLPSTQSINSKSSTDAQIPEIRADLDKWLVGVNFALSINTFIMSLSYIGPALLAQIRIMLDNRRERRSFYRETSATDNGSNRTRASSFQASATHSAPQSGRQTLSRSPASIKHYAAEITSPTTAVLPTTVDSPQKPVSEAFRFPEAPASATLRRSVTTAHTKSARKRLSFSLRSIIRNTFLLFASTVVVLASTKSSVIVITESSGTQLNTKFVEIVLPLFTTVLALDRFIITLIDHRKRLIYLLLSISILAISTAAHHLSEAFESALGSSKVVTCILILTLSVHPIMLLLTSIFTFNIPIGRLLDELDNVGAPQPITKKVSFSDAARSAAEFIRRMSRPGISSSDAPDPTPESTAATPAMMNVATEIFHGVSLEAFNRKNRRRGARRVQHPLNTLLQVYNGILCVTLLLWLAAIGLHIGERLELFKSDLINTVWIIILFTEASVENVVRVWVDLRGGSSNRASIGSAQVQTDCGALGTTVHNENPPNSLLVNTQTAPAQQFQTLGHFQAFARECNSTTPSESNSTTHPRIHYGSDQEEIQFCRSRRVSFIGRRLEDQESPKEGP